MALVDSGADFNIFHAEVAPILGLELKGVKPTPISGVRKSETFNAYMKTVKIGVQGKFFDTAVYFAEGLSQYAHPVVGQLGFFDHFKISFDYKNKNIFIKK